MPRLWLILALLALLLAAIPASASAARYTGTTTQRVGITFLTAPGHVSFLQWRWRVRCPRLARTLAVVSDFSVRRPPYQRLRIIGGRFRLAGETPLGFDRPGMTARSRVALGGLIRGTTASGYLYETLLIYGADQALVDTCRTGRIGWTARVPG